eukprot:4299043-Karenia_brevis.AAC.1
MYARLLYAWTMGNRADVAQHMVGLNVDTVQRYFACFRDVAAWWCIHQGLHVRFNDGVVDADACKWFTERVSECETKHTGRLLILTERGSDKK